MIKMIKNHLGLWSFIFAGLAMLLMPVSVSAWEPQKPVEFVIMAGAGGGDGRHREDNPGWTHCSFRRQYGGGRHGDGRVSPETTLNRS